MKEKIEQWVRKYYKPARFENEPGFNSNREDILIQSRIEDIKREGYTLISHHDSVTGRVEAYGNRPAWCAPGGWHWTEAR